MRAKSSVQTRRARGKPQRILVPVDFSHSSAHALRDAAKRARELGGSVIVVHVVSAEYGWLAFGREELRELDRSLQRQGWSGCALLSTKISVTR
jgi:nucleotide-binding universal stress UspA family protein